MLKSLISLALLTASSSAMAFPCELEGRDTGSWTLHDFSVYNNGNSLREKLENSILAITTATGCGEIELEINKSDREKNNCRNVSRSETSEICYVESKFGYFFVSVDFLNNYNVLFSRWD